MNEFIELEILTESGIIYEVGHYIEQLENNSYNHKYSTSEEIKNNIKSLNSEFSSKTEISIYNCSQIKKVYNYMQPQYGFEHAIYQINFIDESYKYISHNQYKKLREVLLNTKK